MVRGRNSDGLRAGSNDSTNRQNSLEQTSKVHISSLVHKKDLSEDFWIVALGNHLLRIRKWFYGAICTNPEFHWVLHTKPGSAPNLLEDGKMTRWEILKRHVHDVRRLRNLAMLLRVIESHFNGEVKMEKDLTEFMAKKYRWGNKTTRKNLDTLVNLRLLKCLRSPRDHWTKIYYLLDA